MKNVLIIFYSEIGSTESLSLKISNGIESIDGVNCTIRTVASIDDIHKNEIANKDDYLYATLEDVKKCDALIIGSPTNFGNMSSSLKYFIDSLSEIWLNGELEGKPAGVFTSASSIHGGQETTLISMMLPLIHLGMFIVGLPYSIKELGHTTTGCSPYGPSHYSENNSAVLSEDESNLCKAFGKRIANLVIKL